MPLVDTTQAVNPNLLDHAGSKWRSMIRIDTTGGDVDDVSDHIFRFMPERLIYAEGDSWFDKFTPLPHGGMNLLDSIRLPFVSAVVDVSHIGDEVRSMVQGHQARQTRAMFKLFDFHAILLSAGGNDLKNVFAELFAAKAANDRGFTSDWQPQDLDKLANPRSYTQFFEEVIHNIGRFVDLRNSSENDTTRKAPIFVHGYDYFQPRDAGATVFAGSRIGTGPWLYPSMHDAGLTPAQMRSAADAVIDELNDQLKATVAKMANVHVIDARGLLTPANPAATGSNADWMDEIHPNKQGFTKLAQNRWDVPLARKLGWEPSAGDLVPSVQPTNFSTALGPQPIQMA
ncbi:MAG TPA: hypothetical protein VEC35_10260 [Noviherbaspirillum sp.]|nr:hypothetical protein [Noviherbaspirillum sp.]